MKSIFSECFFILQFSENLWPEIDSELSSDERVHNDALNFKSTEIKIKYVMEMLL